MMAMIRALRGELDTLRRVMPRVRMGVVTSVTPLSVALGGAAQPHASVKALDGTVLAAGDVVSVLAWGNDLLVLGRIVAQPAGAVRATDFGGIFDGTSHPLSQRFATLAAAQVVFPFVTALTQQIDWAAITKAIEAARPSLLSPQAGLVYVTGRPYIGDTVEIVGGVTVEGLSSAATICTGPTGFAGPFFDLSLHDGSGHLEFSGQGWAPGLRRVCIRPNTMPSAAALNAGTSDTRQVVDGVWVHDTDGFVLEDVTVEMIAGYHFKIGPVAREASLVRCRSWRGGKASTDKAAVIFENSTGDPNNLIDLSDLHIGYPAYIGLDFSETGTLSTQGSRMIQFTGGQIEGGGYGGSAPAALMTSNTMPAYDLIRVKSGRDLKWLGTEIGGGTAAGQALVRLSGNATAHLGTIDFIGCAFNNVGAGVTIDADRVGVVGVEGGSMFANTAGGATHLAYTTNTVRLEWDPSVQVDSTGEGDLGMPADLTKVKRNLLKWVALTPLNSWANAGGYLAARASVDRFGVVRVEGTISGGTTTFGTALVNLPVGMRPAAARKFVCENNAAVAQVTVGSDGNVLLLGGTNAALSFDGIAFSL